MEADAFLKRAGEHRERRRRTSSASASIRTAGAKRRHRAATRRDQPRVIFKSTRRHGGRLRLKQAGIDVNQYPSTAMSAPREVQAQVALGHPVPARFGPRTQLGDAAAVRRFRQQRAGGRPRWRRAEDKRPPLARGQRRRRQSGDTGRSASTDAKSSRRAAHRGPTPPAPAGTAVPVARVPPRCGPGGTDVAGPGAGPSRWGGQYGARANRRASTLYQTGLPGITIGAHPLAPSPDTGAPPGTVTAAATPPPAQPPPAAQPAAPARRQAGRHGPPTRLQVRAALELQPRGGILESVPDKTGVNQRQAAALRAQAAIYLRKADSRVVRFGLTRRRDESHHRGTSKRRQSRSRILCGATPGRHF